ncbi:hypothetical protein N9243_00185 [bacterium]|jgi:hypothetical protein|nr:hypothetical protein [bacterium]
MEGSMEAHVGPPGRSDQARSGGLWLIAVALAAAIAADAAGAGGDPEARGWVQPGAFAALGAIAAAATLLLALLVGRLGGKRRG